MLSAQVITWHLYAESMRYDKAYAECLCLSAIKEATCYDHMPCDGTHLVSVCYTTVEAKPNTLGIKERHLPHQCDPTTPLLGHSIQQGMRLQDTPGDALPIHLCAAFS